MALHVALTHATSYRYDNRIGMGPQVIRLRPAPHCRTPIVSYSLTIEPKAHFLNWQQDPFGNFLGRVVMPEATDHFSVTVDLVADMAVINPFDFFVEESAERWPFQYDALLTQELGPYLTPDITGPLLSTYLQQVDRTPGRTTVDFLCAINMKLQQDISYLIRMEAGVQTPEVTLANRSGSCRDSAWLLVQILRHLGMAARFVSGYLIQLKPDVKPRGEGVAAGASEDFTDLHAWAEVYVPGAGWIGLDATSGLLAGEGHIPLAATPHPQSAAPISGAHQPAQVTFDYKMAVTRVLETPRVTKPYGDETWQAILDGGRDVDARLEAGDVRLSMGGEPTFVAADDMEADEWNTAAVGPSKRKFAEDLVRRMQQRLAPGGLLHYGQGKWYPGEPLPRWAFAVYWRTDGKPLWRDAALIAREGRDNGATIDKSLAFVEDLSARLGLARDSGIPAYEDASLLILTEQKQPLGDVAEDDGDPDVQAERARLARALDRGLNEAAAYVLPLKVSSVENRKSKWVTERWQLRRDKLVLVPGDSPAGLRLPLASLPPIAAEDFPHVQPLDPMATVPPLPDPSELSEGGDAAAKPEPKAPSAEPIEAVRTALVVEPRNGTLCIFMPPLETADDYATLLTFIEDSARGVGTPVHVEGYGPPYDPRFQVLKVTPDPGVIEVNVQPASSWDEIVANTTALYDDAHDAGLSAEKFMVDGKHTGTGGGNHIVLGGMSPSESPFLRRPDLLASIIAYWQNHPSLSYLFAGLFIGPTSQAPRSDEARFESIYELEIALAQIPDPKEGTVPPWLVDRLFRNLLIDVTGNTHRAEICIDKLYSPDGPTGRLGLVEFRSFEMPPHARMSLAQQLLVRALIAMFWEKPYKQSLIRWGTALHDRFMLPHFLWSDLESIAEDLKAAGLPADAEWFRPHLEFRFPRCGAIEYANTTLEIRQALEPWHVLGEESSTGGTARYVDSSLERIQVKASGLYGDRLVVTCNGHAVPLTPTGVQGETVAGIRFRAWQPPSALHPNIPVHVPLVIDLFDTWTGRAVAGCRYHVSHPGGRAHETFPINAYEAEGRRLARFEVLGHTPGTTNPGRPVINSDYPHTLDLRRANLAG